MNSRHWLASTAIAAVSLVWADAAHAEDKAPDHKPDSGQVEEVVVTAERTTSTVQRTPISMTAVQGAELVRQGVRNAQDLTGKVPNINIANNVGTMTVVIRGVGTNYDNQSAEPAVNVNVDGVYLARAVSASGAFFDIERVEALRGPQGTLYGRNSTGGSLNIITNKPVQVYQGAAEVEFGNYNLVHTSGMLNIPVVSDKLAVRAAFQTERHDGYTRNGPATDYNDADSVALRFHALFTPTERLSLLFSADYGRYGGVGPNHVTTPQANKSFTVPMDVDGRQNTPLYGSSVQLNYRFDGLTLTYIGAYRYFHRNQFFDNDFKQTVGVAGKTPYSVYNWMNNNWSHEVRLASPGDAKLKWVLGGFYYTEHNNYLYISGAPSPATVSTCFCDPNTNANSYAAFGQATYRLTDSFALTAGLRYTRDHKDETGQTIITPVSGAPTIVTNLANLNWENTSGKVGAEWNVTSRSMLYASASNAYKAGGYFDGLNNLYKPEKLTSYEVGSKNRFLDGRVQLNAAAFYYDYRDFQAVYVVTLPGGARVAATGNAKKARSQGVEAEAIFRATPDDRFDFSATYLDAKFLDFVLNSTPAQNYSGFTMPRAPTATLTAGYGHTWRLDKGGSVAAHVQTHYETSSWLMFQHFPGSQQPAYTRTDVDLSYESGNHWYVAAYARNLENRPVAGNAIAGTGNVPALDLMPPLTVGMRLGARF